MIFHTALPARRAPSTQVFVEKQTKGLLTERAQVTSSTGYIRKQASVLGAHIAKYFKYQSKTGTAKLCSRHLNLRIYVSSDAADDIIDSESNRRSVPLCLAFAIGD